ncbi:MAG: nuclear transport factor 2 family protein [Candidatus Sumerlaeota bacterium]|nr:nuclear transport factor 2 family protein [Candidatus Sumerlaeota bacterium]
MRPSPRDMRDIVLYHWFRSLLIVIVFASAVFILFHYVLISDETRIERLIHSVANAMQNKSVNGVVKHLAPEYVDSEFNTDVKTLPALLMQFYLEFQEIQTVVKRTRIQVNGAKARAQVVAAVYVVSKNEPGKRYALFTGDADKGVFDLELEKRDGQWLIVSARRPKAGFE